MRQTALKLKLVASKPLLVLLVLTPVLLFGVAGRYFLNNQAAAVTNSTINFQARLMTNTGSIAPDGDYNVEFKLYDALTSSGSSQGSCTGDTHCLWTETRTSANVIHVANGYISANLGSVTGFPTTINWDQQLYLTMNIGGTGSPTWDGEMSPRLKLTAVPYAFRASQLAALAGAHTGVLQFAASLAQDSVVTLPDPGAGTATVCYQSSSACGFLTGTAGSYIQNTTTVQAPGNIAIRSAAIGSVAALIQGANGQTADLLDVQSYNGTTGTNVFSVSNVGVLTVAGAQTADITTAASAGASANALMFQPGTSGGASSNGAAATIKGGNASGTTSVTGGLLTLQGGNATGASGTRNGGSVTIDGGTGATSNGGINIGTANAANTIQIGSTTLSSGTQTINIGNNGTSGGTTNVTIGSGAGATGGTTTVQAKTSISLLSGTTTSVKSADSTTTSTGAITLQSGSASTGTNLSAGAVTIDTGTHTGVGTGVLNVGNANATAINLGNTTGTLSIQGGSGTTMVINNGGGNTTTLNFTAPSGANTITFPAASGTVQLAPASGGYIQQVPGSTATNTIAPTAASVVALTVKGTTGTAAHVIDIYNSSATPTLQAFFDAAGSLNVSQLIQPTANNTIDLGTSSAAFRTGYFGTSIVVPSVTTNGATALGLDTGGAAAVNIGGTNANAINIGNATTNPNVAFNGSGTFGTTTGNNNLNGNTAIAANKNFSLTAGTGTITQTFSAATAGNGQTLGFANTNTGAGIAIQGINLTPTNTATAASGTNQLNLINFAAGGALGGTDNTTGLNFASATGYTNFIKTPTFVLNSAGAISGVTTYNGLTLTSQSDGFTLAGGTTSRTLTVTGADITVGNVIKPTSAGALTVQANGANSLTLTAGAASTWDIGNNLLSLQTTNNGAITTGTGLWTQGGNMTFNGTTARTITGPTTGGLTITDAGGPLALSTTGSGTLSLNSAGALNLTGAAASTWSTGAATLALQSANFNVGTNGLVTLTGGLTPDVTTAVTGGVAAALTLGPGTATGANNGATLTLQGGTAGGTGVRGLIQMNGATYYTAGTYSSGSSATITQGLIDSNSAILATATTAGLTFTVPSPTITAASGRVLYITNNGANAFTLTFASSNLSLSPGATATLIWSGTAWTGAGADSATLQNDYTNSAGGNTPEILLDSTRKGLDIQDANTTLGSTVPLLAVRSSATATTLGNPLFVVENNAGAPLVGIGTATASRALDVAVNNSTVNGMPVLIEQAGSGDTGIEYKAGAKSFYEGVDGTDGAFKISSVTAANGTATQGNTNSSGFDAGDDVNAGGTQATKLVAAVSGSVSSISAYLNSTGGGNLQVGIYSDNGSGTGPGTLLASSSVAVATVGWNTLSISGAPTMTSGTTYWLALATSAAAHYKFGTGGTTVFDTTAYPVPTGSSWVTTAGPAAQLMDLYATVTTGISDEFAGTPLFRLTDTGQTTLQNATNSTTAFQVLNLAGTTLLGVDTSNAAVNLGVTGATAQAGSVNIGTSTGATQTINIGGPTLGSASNGTTVLLQGGNTSTAVKIEALSGGAIGIGTGSNATVQLGSTTLSSGTQVIGIGNNNTAGGITNITIGSGSSTAGGTTTVQGRTATNVTSNGAVTITAGATSTWSTTAGNINVQAGSASGVLNFTGGTATGVTTAGAVNIQGGAAAATAGSNGGGVNILGGVGTATGTGGAGGTLYLSAGNAQGTGNNAGGNITLNLGSATGTGTQGTFQVQNALGANLLTVDPTNTAASLNLISNSGAETGSPPTGWAAQGTGSSVATGTGSDAASGTQSAKVTFGTSANAGVKASFATAPTASTTVNYIVSFTAKLVSGTALSNTLQVVYSPDNGTTLTATCSNYSTQGLTTTGWTKVSCTFVPGSTTVTTALLIIRQTDAPGTSRVIDIDNLSVVQQNSAGTSNVGDLKVGGSTSQGLTLLTLDTYSANPFTGSNASLAGSMYFDTSQGKIQCYDGSSWGACGAAPNNIITLSPEYAGAVLHQSGSSSIGTMTSDFCSSSSGININDGTSSQPSICNANQTFNFYRWTSPQGSAQQYSIWVTYQLPSTFKNFVTGTTTLTGRTDSTNSTVQYTIYKNVSGTSTVCSASKVVSTGAQSNWQVIAPTTDPSTCSFAAGNSIVIQIDGISSNNANAYISNLNFAFSNQ